MVKTAVVMLAGPSGLYEKDVTPCGTVTGSTWSVQRWRSVRSLSCGCRSADEGALPAVHWGIVPRQRYAHNSCSASRICSNWRARTGVSSEKYLPPSHETSDNPASERNRSMTSWRWFTSTARIGGSLATRGSHWVAWDAPASRTRLGDRPASWIAGIVLLMIGRMSHQGRA